MALSGLRMMPPFPYPPLKFRTASFPQYGFKADVSDDAFLFIDLLKPAPGVRNAIDSLLSSFVSSKTETVIPDLPGGLSLPIPPLGPHGLTPEVLAPVRVVVSLSINTY